MSTTQMATPLAGRAGCNDRHHRKSIVEYEKIDEEISMTASIMQLAYVWYLSQELIG